MPPLVVVPTYNERRNLPALLERVLEQGVHVLIVDDDSPDGTGVIADRAAAEDERVFVLHRSGKLGLGTAYREGFAWGRAGGYDVLCEMDADLSHDPADLPRLITALEGADVVVGSRYTAGGGTVGWPWHRHALSVAGSLYVRILTGCPVRDATAGFRAYSASVIDKIDVPDAIHSEGYAFQIEVLLRAWNAGFRVVEVPITFTERVEGVSKMSRRIVFEALRQVPVWAREIRFPQELSHAKAGS
jgi:dolichol-phosphate mannosyltransferase